MKDLKEQLINMARPLVVSRNWEILLFTEDDPRGTAAGFLPQIAVLQTSDREPNLYQIKADLVTSAVSHGVSYEGTISFLRRNSRVTLPQNIEFELRDMFHVPKVALTARGHRLMISRKGKLAERVDEAVESVSYVNMFHDGWEVQPKKLGNMVKKLAKNGIALDDKVGVIGRDLVRLEELAKEYGIPVEFLKKRVVSYYTFKGYHPCAVDSNEAREKASKFDQDVYKLRTRFANMLPAEHKELLTAVYSAKGKNKRAALSANNKMHNNALKGLFFLAEHDLVEEAGENDLLTYLYKKYRGEFNLSDLVRIASGLGYEYLKLTAASAKYLFPLGVFKGIDGVEIIEVGNQWVLESTREEPTKLQDVVAVFEESARQDMKRWAKFLPDEHQKVLKVRYKTKGGYERIQARLSALDIYDSVIPKYHEDSVRCFDFLKKNPDWVEKNKGQPVDYLRERDFSMPIIVAIIKATGFKMYRYWNFCKSHVIPEVTLRHVDGIVTVKYDGTEYIVDNWELTPTIERFEASVRTRARRYWTSLCAKSRQIVDQRYSGKDYSEMSDDFGYKEEWDHEELFDVLDYLDGTDTNSIDCDDLLADLKAHKFRGDAILGVMRGAGYDFQDTWNAANRYGIDEYNYHKRAGIKTARIGKQLYVLVSDQTTRKTLQAIATEEKKKK